MNRFTFLCLSILLGGCAGHVPVKPLPTPAPVQKISEAELHLLGTWEMSSRTGVPKQMVFNKGGTVAFHGGLEFFNPGLWTLYPERNELALTFPETSDEKMDIFQLYVGEGIKSFDRPRKQVTYRFDEQTWSLNVGGWVYAKPDQPAATSGAEPVLK